MSRWTRLGATRARSSGQGSDRATLRFAISTAAYDRGINLIVMPGVRPFKNPRSRPEAL